MTEFYPHYFCLECKKVVKNFESLYFIDKFSSKGFCSVDCIEDFYLPIVKHFEDYEKLCRESLQIFEENIVSTLDPVIAGQLNNAEKISENPSEVYEFKNELDDTFYVFIKSLFGIHGLVLATTYDGKLSFVFLHTITANPHLLNYFRKGQPILNDWLAAQEQLDFAEIELAVIDKLEAKKSFFLAKILEVKKQDDIDFEQYSDFSHLYLESLNAPEEVYRYKDIEGDWSTVFIKSHLESNPINSSPIFYIVLVYGDFYEKTKELMPYCKLNTILSFPTRDEDLVTILRNGPNLCFFNNYS